MKDLHGTLYSMRRDLNSFNETVNNLSVTVGNLEDNQNKLHKKINMIDLKLDSVKEKIQKKFRAMETKLDNYQQQTASELAGLRSSVKAHDNHVTTELTELDQSLQQHYGYLTTLPIHTCGGTGGWRRVVYLNFTDPNTPCPPGWKLTSLSKRTCGRVSTGLSCDSVTFPVSGENYTRVCGRIIAYQDEYPQAFRPYHDGLVTTIDGAYVHGVSLTRGSPRQHIWTFAAGMGENWNITPRTILCPCDTTYNITIPPFVGGDYFCEAGRHPGDPYGFYPEDPLWDGDGCTATSTCCSFNNPPYFTKQLPSPTTDDIEARLCHRFSNEDAPIEFIELYVQ